MKSQSLLLLMTFLMSFATEHAPSVPAAGSDLRSLEDSVSLMYISDAIQAGYTDLDSVASASVLFSAPANPPREDPDNASLAAALQAAKDQREDLDASCSLMVSRLRAAGKNCEADRVQAACEEKKGNLNAEIGRLHDLRGDRRRPLTKAWHWLKRQGGSVWSSIGPGGRKFLRQVGPEVLQVVASGGSLSGGVLRNILKQQAKAMGRQRLREIVYQGVERLLLGQIELARSAGVDLCDPSKDTSGSNQGQSSSDVITYPLTTSKVDFAWHALLQPEDQFHSCGGLWPDQDEAFKPITFPVQIDRKTQTITAQFSGSRKIENLADGDSGPVVTRINQDYQIKLDGPYQAAEIVEGVVLSLTGTASLTLTQDGEVECHYWVIPDQGDPVLKKYWVSRIQTINLEKPYEIRISSPNEDTRELTLLIFGGNWGENSFFALETQPVTISIADLILLWPE